MNVLVQSLDEVTQEVHLRGPFVQIDVLLNVQNCFLSKFSLCRKSHFLLQLLSDSSNFLLKTSFFKSSALGLQLDLEKKFLEVLEVVVYFHRPLFLGHQNRLRLSSLMRPLEK